jgi:hypothetical protein
MWLSIAMIGRRLGEEFLFTETVNSSLNELPWVQSMAFNILHSISTCENEPQIDEVGTIWLHNTLLPVGRPFWSIRSALNRLETHRPPQLIPNIGSGELSNFSLISDLPFKQWFRFEKYLTIWQGDPANKCPRLAQHLRWGTRSRASLNYQSINH